MIRSTRRLIHARSTLWVLIKGCYRTIMEADRAITGLADILTPLKARIYYLIILAHLLFGEEEQK